MAEQVDFPRLTVGLRFTRADGPLLRSIFDRLISEGRTEDAGLFDAAAQSAERDDPLELVCNTRDEAERIAHGFTRWGIERPAIDELNG